MHCAGNQETLSGGRATLNNDLQNAWLLARTAREWGRRNQTKENLPMKTEHEFVAEMTRKNARESLMNARNTLERALQDMESFVAQFDVAATDGDRAKILNWTINHLVSSIQPNLRIDMLADRQSELAKRG